MRNKYQKRDIFLKRKNKEYFMDLEGENYGTLETYKAKAQLHIVLNGLISSKDLSKRGENYEAVLMETGREGAVFISLGNIVIDEKGQVRVIKKIDLNQFEMIHGDIWNSQKLLIVAVCQEGESQVVLEGLMMEDFQEEEPLRVFFSNLVKGEQEKQQDFNPFGRDETHAKWYKVCGLESCPKSLSNYVEKGSKYGHYLIGCDDDKYYVAIPGRFMAEEEVSFGDKETSLWQPLRGAESLCQGLETLDEEARQYIYGYWIGALAEDEDKIVNC